MPAIFPKEGLLCIWQRWSIFENDERGQEILQSLEEGHEEKEAVETKVTFGWQIF